MYPAPGATGTTSTLGAGGSVRTMTSGPPTLTPTSTPARAARGAAQASESRAIRVSLMGLGGLGLRDSAPETWMGAKCYQTSRIPGRLEARPGLQFRLPWSFRELFPGPNAASFVAH